MRQVTAHAGARRPARQRAVTHEASRLWRSDQHAQTPTLQVYPRSYRWLAGGATDQCHGRAEHYNTDLP